MEIITTCAKVGIASAIHIDNIDRLLEWRDEGMQMLIYNSDLGFLTGGATSGITALKINEDYKPQ